MNNAQKVNSVSLSLNPAMSALDEFYDRNVGKGEHNIVLLVGAGDVVQFVANCPRDQSKSLLQGMLARWEVGLPDTMPGEVSPGDTRAFEYLLNEFEKAVRLHAAGSAGQAHIDTRDQVVQYVGELLARSKR